VIKHVLMIGIAMMGGVVQADLADGLYAAIETSMGSITCRLDYAEAPLTCANFVGLAEGTQHWIEPQTGLVRNEPFYDGLIFHRVMDGFMIQGGCPLGTGTSGPGYRFPDEFHSNLTHRAAGILSMANSGPDSNGSQFFITLAETDWLDGVHSVFGEVVGGMGVISNIGGVAVTSSRPDVDVEVFSVRILRQGIAAQGFDVSMQPLPDVSPLNLSLTHAPEGLEVLAGLTNQSTVSIYASTNLLDWALSSKKYWRSASNDWHVAVTSGRQTEFFRGVRVHNPQINTNVPASVAQHTLNLTLDGVGVELRLLADGGGVSIYNGGAAGTLYAWEWERGPFSGNLYVQSSDLAPLNIDFSYASATNGTCKGHYYNGGWRPLSGIFVDSLTP
jgi:cyclophilin family peptidyl-prolyl cis-trans isomerase